jgi:ribosomal protein S12 methylthiotransferase
MLQAMASSSKVLPYLDIPLQHVADGVLKAMGRGLSQAQLYDLLALARETLPGLTIRTTILVGHPGEGDQEFTELLEFINKVKVDHLGCFAYQAEPGTRSARLEAPTGKVGNARRAVILRAQKVISKQKLREKVGKEMDLLVLGPHPESPLLGVGRLASQAPEVDGEVIITDGQAQPGGIVRCKVTKAHAYDLEAVILD